MKQKRTEQKKGDFGWLIFFDENLKREKGLTRNFQKCFTNYFTHTKFFLKKPREQKKKRKKKTER